MTPSSHSSLEPPRRRLTMWALALVATTAGVGLWWWLRPRAVEPPPLPEVHETEVRQVLDDERRRVIEEPDSAFTWGRLGKVFLAHLFDREADACFAQAARLDPDDPLWPYGRAVIALKREPDAALALLRQAVASAKSRPEHAPAFRLQLAEALLERGEADEAEALFRGEHVPGPYAPRAAFGLGLVALERGEPKEALRWLTAARADPHARKKSAVQLAAAARAAGDAAAATAYQKEAAALPDDPPWPDPLLDEVVGLQVGRRGRERRAARLEHERRFAEAADLFLEALKTDPTVDAYLGAGINLARVRDYDRATPLLREALRLRPDDAHVRYSLALALFARAERQASELPDAKEPREWFREAVGHARRAAELKPDHARSYLFWGLALKHLGEPKAAVEPLRRGVGLEPDSLELQLGLGEALWEAGQTREAETHLQNAARLAPNDPRPAKALERLRGKTPPP